ncbi:hypothetical protein GQ602_003726 [Ophiocordyceps camponoti-floridani]|uniref:Uncharacterized protein n=1 Tax=Ophiocordyceps camponoti-floridani TaxID=2030778 RepID=A0A8H4Q8Q9_9HYPO|nr:hypothetical protein GQ602_003726 [Ophiocordyceps camponoti-floridani]
MAWFCGDREKDTETVTCKYTRRSRCYSPVLSERRRTWYYDEEPRCAWLSPMSEAVVCFEHKDWQKCKCGGEEVACPCVKRKEDEEKKCPCIRKKEEDEKKCACLKKKEEDDKKCPCVKKKEEDDKKCACLKKKEEEPKRTIGYRPDQVFVKILSSRDSAYDEEERFTFEVYDRTDGPIYRQHGECCILSLSIRSSIDDIIRFLAPDRCRQKVMVRWCDGNVEELDDRIPISEVRRFARRFYVKERKRARFL